MFPFVVSKALVRKSYLTLGFLQSTKILLLSLTRLIQMSYEDSLSTADHSIIIINICVLRGSKLFKQFLLELKKSQN